MKELILAFDQDWYVAAGTPTVTPTIDSSARYNGYHSDSGTANNDKKQYQRYFPKGGLYKATFVYAKLTNGAKVDIGLDSSTNNILSQVDTYNASTTRDNKISAPIEISRGFHVISLLANGRNAGNSTGYVIPIQALEFEIIEEYVVYQDDEIPGSFVIETIEKDMSDESTTAVSGTGTKASFTLPWDGYLVAIRQGCQTAPTTSAITLDVLDNSGTTVFVTKPTIAANAKYGSDGVLKLPPIKVTEGDTLQMQVNTVDTGGTTKGLKMYLYFARRG